MSHSRDPERPPSSGQITRRRLLQAGGAALVNFSLPGVVAARGGGNQPLSGHAANRSCIFILLCGGPSHLDT